MQCHPVIRTFPTRRLAEQRLGGDMHVVPRRTVFEPAQSYVGIGEEPREGIDEEEGDRLVRRRGLSPASPARHTSAGRNFCCSAHPHPRVSPRLGNGVAERESCGGIARLWMPPQCVCLLHLPAWEALVGHGRRAPAAVTSHAARAGSAHVALAGLADID